MSINVGSIDRIFRALLGLILIALPFLTTLGILWSGVSVVVGLTMLVVAATLVCPVYTIFGIRTCK